MDLGNLAKKMFFILGPGMIGKKVRDELIEHDASVMMFRKEDLANLEQNMDTFKPGGFFFCPPSKHVSESTDTALRIMKHKVTPISTCEKILMSYGYQKMIPYLDHIGANASVGGGNQFIAYLEGRNLRNNFEQIDAVLNGSINFILEQAYEMRGPFNKADVIVKMAKHKKILEPGSSSLSSIIKNEIEDIIMKICCLWNTCIGDGFILTPKHFWRSDYNLGNALKEWNLEGNKRCVVRITRSLFQDQRILASASPGEYKISILFIDLSNEVLGGFSPSGVNNFIYLKQGLNGKDGEYYLGGPGAGPDATVSAMLSDMSRLLRKK